MWRAGVDVNSVQDDDDDDWDTNPDFENDVSEQQQRWGSKTVEGSGKVHVDGGLEKLRTGVQEDTKSAATKVDFARGYGGKYGVEQVSYGSMTSACHQASAHMHTWLYICCI
eukprot:TRINITY_DN12221_c1_g1_i2.p3 TRINITY_DN12221_c1_g1~~TRINITY_DN12221_c1_g1_i2.p3  ORF type:complete len:112 (+),score=22.25 TRINITY_DN12221_c1_g1_i2:36-371(+)